MSTSVNNVAIVPVNVFWKMEQTEAFDFSGLTASGIAGKYVKMWSAKDETAYYVWWNTGSSVDPAVAGKSDIEVSILSTDTPTQIAAKTATAVALVSGFDADSSGAVMTVKRTSVGEATEAADQNSGVQVSLIRRGRDMDLGLLQGDVECSFAPSNFTLTSHQTGLTPLAAINQGFETLECTTTMLETQKSNLKEIYKIYGGSSTPIGGSEVFGVGSAVQGKNMMVEAGRLVLKPVGASDDKSNFNFMLAIPVPDSLVFSGENPRTLSITWQGFVDREFNPKFNAIAIGDVSQAGL
jgi:hypothetical protein